jgi:hypothetical protein
VLSDAFILYRDGFYAIHETRYPQDHNFGALRNDLQLLGKSARINNIGHTPMKIDHALILGRFVGLYSRGRKQFRSQGLEVVILPDGEIGESSQIEPLILTTLEKWTPKSVDPE